jgi:hypothetical protein
MSLTAFPREELRLRHSHADAPVAAATFDRPLARCDLGHCRGMCCYDGIFLEPEVAAMLPRLARDEAAFFAGLGLRLPDQVVVDGEWRGQVRGPKTAVAPRPLSQTVPGFPRHFHDTACVFATADGRCGLQLLSVARGRHPWFYKPFGCWLHPITLWYEGRACIGVEDERTDSCRLPGYDGFLTATFCGQTAPSGRPAREVLREELAFLGAILQRELTAACGLAPR